jgi:uncharacterized protein (TIGR03435 family)
MHSMGFCTLRSGFARSARCAAAPFLALIFASAAPAQSPAAGAAGGSAPSSSPSFDVAAIRPHQPEPHERSHIVDSSGRFTTVNVDLKAILQWAYDLPASRIVGGPAWIDSARWDIEAKAENALDTQKTFDPAAARLEKQGMVQALLAERFGLVVHRETRQLPIYALVVAKGGPTFLAAQAGGTTIDRNRGRIQIEGGDNTVSLLAEQLAETLGRVVVDETGIAGRYKLALAWAPDDSAGSPSAVPDSGPSLFTALQEQLGLKLESRKGPVDVLVVDQAALPSPN